MRQFYTVVAERMATFSESFDTEPYECGWASEAIFFIRVHQIDGIGTKLDSRLQISVDGIDWVDDGECFPTISGCGTYFLKATHFGGWVRLRNEVSGENPSAKVTVHIVLKE